ncbi:hypothetical protein CLCOS_30150 [Clostridium coskatii]|jgi:hypothetical protein|uniref:Uncharacterized protein n=1 Tax=Clostridium coskatii TaxID=1705578 RepID=A0A166T594_9CLOT|nr:hypothetical protein WX73_00002 [Clostridium coskatii]OBR92552.1 hypothetical protein CLCOS_30150 [Clostridium coskatii]
MGLKYKLYSYKQGIILKNLFPFKNKYSSSYIELYYILENNIILKVCSDSNIHLGFFQLLKYFLNKRYLLQ